MAAPSANKLFDEEVGAYFAALERGDRVGVCERCLAVRLQTEVDAREMCPASLLEVGLTRAERADGHKWKVPADAGELREYLREHMPRFRELRDSLLGLVRQG